MDFKRLNIAIGRLRDTSAVLIQGLDVLEELHPFVQVAVDVFKLVLTLKMASWETSKKVLLVSIQMQDMMSALFQLRNIRRSDEKGPDGLTLKDKMSPLMESISGSIQQCGNACDVYAGKDVLAMTIKIGDYEKMLADFVKEFYAYKHQIEQQIVPTSDEDAAYEDLGDQVMTIQGMLMKIFPRLDTPLEAKARAFVNAHGDVKKWINITTTLAAFVELTGRHMASFDQTRMSDTDRGSCKLKQKLKCELEEPLQTALEKHSTFFSAKLALHREQLTKPGEHVVVELRGMEDRVIDSISGGEYKKVTDADLNALWRKERWQSNVKARSFALGLRYHFIEKFTMSQTHDHEGDSFEVDDETASISLVGGQNIPPAAKQEDDRWALAYLGVTYLHQIIEAVDDDGAGYLSINVVNQFCRRRPEKWSLLHWVAFCAAGWHNSVTWYRTRIYNILSAMVTVLQSVKSQNLQAATTYLAGIEIQRVELLLRATRPTERPALKGTPLRRITDEHQKEETAKFERRLHRLKYQLDDDALKLVAKGRVEHYVYPLLYVLLKDQFEKLRRACTQTLDEADFQAMSTSIASIFRAVDTRRRKLKAIFKSHDLDVDEHMGQFAFGMFELTSAEHRRDPINNTILTFIEDPVFKYNGENLRLGESDVLTPDSTTTFSFSRRCDHSNCHKQVNGIRILCVQCMDDVFLHTVDLCSSCFEAEVWHLGIHHTAAHLMIETTRPIHDGEMAVLVPKSKELAQTVKTVFNGNDHKSCCCCGVSVAPPCWVCIVCDEDTYVCKACHAKRATVLPDGENSTPKHTLAHLLLWIFDKIPIEEVSSADIAASFTTLEARIAAMEDKFERRLLTLENYFTADGRFHGLTA
ncbi:hypothetical protein DFH08DRAFT_886888 [Mycena albidolilacea]|uniref:ZZ-type domain-containing protein n=1 Tax=Mycena albidolilacea TaxID=1033008 RepID=A0AAD6ZJJ0_9AGAR|nr:hypothetical protein DFH08DRAFT_886888 [Mycena albidolilacea]